MSTHITSDLEHIADYIIFIDKGRVELEETRDEIFDKYGILKCEIDKFDTIDKNDIVSYKKNKYNYDILVNDKKLCEKKYKDYVIDKITLEDLMLLIIKGDKVK
jgi:ABC-2 type transport system ATP-binding protein